MPYPSQSPAEPPRPPVTATLHEFGRQLRELRRWSRLTQKALEDGHPLLTDSTISDHERGVRLPRLEWVTAYVQLCLQHHNPGITRPQLEAELDHWRAAWTRLEHADPQHAPAIRTSSTSTTPTAADDHTTRARAARRRMLLIGGATTAVVAVVIMATATGLFRTSPDTDTLPAATAAPAVPVHASGTVEDLRGVEGIDLDTNNRADQEAPGIDISFAATSTHLNAMATRVTFTVLPESGPAERQRCVTAVDWMRQIPNIYDLTEGRNICVITNEGRFSMLTITKRASSTTGTIDFRYTTWP